MYACLVYSCLWFS